MLAIRPSMKRTATAGVATMEHWRKLSVRKKQGKSTIRSPWKHTHCRISSSNVWLDWV